MSAVTVATDSRHVEELVRTLSLCFHDDAVVQHFLRQDDRNSEASARFFRLAVERMSLPYGEVQHTEVAGDVVAVALWVPPGCWSLGLAQQLRLLRHAVPIAGRHRLVTALRGLHHMDRCHPHEPHMYLSFLCTHPEHRGRGLGSQLLRAMTERCDRQRLPIYLENTKASNEAFYRHHGFEPRGTIPLPGGPSYYLGMWRRPR